MTIAEAALWLQQCGNAAILIHQNPDGDCTGSGYALAAILQQLGKRAVVLCSDAIPRRLSFLRNSAFEQMDFTVESVISVDVADKKLLGALQEAYGDKVQLAIDHHLLHVPFAEETCVISDAAAACQIVCEIAKKMPVTITPYIAKCLYTGMATDSGCFQFDNTSAATHRRVAELMELCPEVPYGKINRALFAVKTMDRLRLEHLLHDRMQTFFDGKCAAITMTLDFMEENGIDPAEMNSVENFPMQLESVEVGLTLKEREPNVFKISTRSADTFNVAELCSEFGGGGHFKAAGCLIKGTPEEVLAKLLAAVERRLAAL